MLLSASPREERLFLLLLALVWGLVWERGRFFEADSTTEQHVYLLHRLWVAYSQGLQMHFGSSFLPFSKSHSCRYHLLLPR